MKIGVEKQAFFAKYTLDAMQSILQLKRIVFECFGEFLRWREKNYGDGRLPAPVSLFLHLFVLRQDALITLHGSHQQTAVAAAVAVGHAAEAR